MSHLKSMLEDFNRKTMQIQNLLGSAWFTGYHEMQTSHPIFSCVESVDDIG
jgi:hypothetical protein